MSTAVEFVSVVTHTDGTAVPDPITFEVSEGEFVFIRHSPAEATRFIRLLAGLRAPVSGHVIVLGAEPCRLNRKQGRRFRRRLGVAFHQPSGLVSNLDLEMNLVVPQIYGGHCGPEQAHRAACQLLDRLDLGNWCATRPADLPPEVRREAAVARALVRQPELLVLEEPTDGLEDDRAARMMDLCREHAKTILITGPEPDEVILRAADRSIFTDEDGNGMGVV